MIGLVALTGYLLACLVSYSAFDPGWTSTGVGGPIRNLGGRFGAWFADLFLHAFGYSAYLFPLIFGLLSARILRRSIEVNSRHVRIMHGLGFTLTVVSACGIEFLHFGSGLDRGSAAGGGWLGIVVGSWLLDVFGSVGATVALVVSLVAGLSWALDVSWFTIMDRVGAWS